MAATARVVVGRVVRPWGREGGVRVEPLTHDSRRFERLREVTVVHHGAERRVGLHRCRIDGDGFALLWLDGSTTITEAERLRGALLAIEEDQVERPVGAYFHHELLGAEVCTTAGQTLGRVHDILDTAATSVLVVRAGEAEVLVPLADGIIAAVDVAARRITVDPIPGLLELNHGKGHAV